MAQYAGRFAYTNDDPLQINANGDYSLAPQEFIFAPAPGEIFYLSDLIVSIQDDGTLDTNAYGNAIVLTNGIRIELWHRGELLRDLTDQKVIYTNIDWKAYCHDDQVADYGSGDQIASYVFNVKQAMGEHNTVMDGSNLDAIKIILNDDFSSLTGHYFRCTGHTI